MDAQTAASNQAFNERAEKVVELVQHAIDTGREGTDVPRLTASGITYNILDVLGILPSREKQALR